MLVLLIGGCALLQGRGTDADDATPAQPPAAQPEEPADPEPVPAEPALTAAEAAELESLLDRADRAIADDHLTYPASGSALSLYDRARLLDPDNERARRGLERIVERYLELAVSAAERRRFDEARGMLDRAHIVDPDHAGIAPTFAQIELLDDADRRVITLDGEHLRNRDPALERTLREAGVASRGSGCRAEITARNDSEGRWIYQQMSAGGGLARIQAQLNIGSPARIEILCFRP
ncbi:MAG: hypothetical protein RIC56_00960 [Pseudomonadales bacterium]